MTRNPKVEGVIWFISVAIFLSTMFTAAFVITGWVYQLIGITPSALVAQLINSIGGLFLTALIIGAMSRIFQSKIVNGQMTLFKPIIDALERIAQGDFSARVDNDPDRGGRENAMIVELVKSVNQTALQLHQMENMRQEFISNVSHELQSPLTSIRGFAHVLQSDDLSMADRHHYLTIIETESMRLSRLTDNLLKLASLEAEQVKFEPKPYRLDKQIRNLILACEPQWSSKNIEMDVVLEEVTICADEDLLSQVWINLLNNSIKFTPENGQICIALSPQGDQALFKIDDTGIGISEGDREHIFERFYKADKSRTRTDTGGSGLGLSITQKIVEMHHGVITVDSLPGAGTTFTVMLPVDGHPV
jgi:two-component system, OmpR family, phosphate regulon sensor histidine kinase PhoR